LVAGAGDLVQASQSLVDWLVALHTHYADEYGNLDADVYFQKAPSLHRLQQLVYAFVTSAACRSATMHPDERTAALTELTRVSPGRLQCSVYPTLVALAANTMATVGPPLPLTRASIETEVRTFFFVKKLCLKRTAWICSGKAHTSSTLDGTVFCFCRAKTHRKPSF
jgi:hypothetical protein